MKKDKFLIAGGNSTLLVWDCPLMTREEIIKLNLGKVEQIGFVDKANLNMMGNELCINATLAFAYQFSKSGLLKTSGLEGSVKFWNNKYTTLEFDLPYKKVENIILFSGIGFICSNSQTFQNKRSLQILANKYSLPAFGVVGFKNNQIKPFVYVKETSSMFPESACGSGSIAFSIFSGFENIVHPTGQSILVRQRGSKFTVTAKVVRI